MEQYHMYRNKNSGDSHQGCNGDKDVGELPKNENLRLLAFGLTFVQLVHHMDLLDST
mgnify:CR=1 FL=1|jgi:hypothetical protein